jgi:hypothetical protein
MSDDPIRDYLGELGKELGRFAPGRRRTLAEVEDHLRETALSLEAGGAEPPAAQRKAIAAFGSPRQVTQFTGRRRQPAGRKRIVIGAGLAVIAAGTAGVFWIGHVSPGGLSSAPPAPKTGTLAGWAVFEGGDMISDNGGIADLHGVGRARITVIGRTAAGTYLVRRFVTDERGWFRLNLPAGRYTVEAPTLVPTTQPHAIIKAGRAVFVLLKHHVQ